jgi:RNA polymerase sigma-70 factor (ECF subfamily)
VIDESSAELASLLLGLPEHERVSLVLRHVAGIGYAEIGEALGCPVGTVKARVHRGLRSLERLMDNKREDAAEEESA